MIGFRNQTNVLQHIARNILHSTSPSNWNLVSPPQFIDQSWLAKQIVEAIKALRPDIQVAVVTADIISDRANYGATLQRGWKKGGDNQSIDSTNLEDVLARLDPEHPGIQVVLYFEKIITLKEVSILGLMREAERNSCLRTITVSAYPYNTLRDLWRSENHVFIGSDYGDSHERLALLPVFLEEVHRTCLNDSIPSDIINFIYYQTGGYPYPFDNALNKWNRDGRPPLRPDYRQALIAFIEPMLDRFIKWMDRKDTSFFRQHTANLYAGLHVEKSLSGLMMHDWRDVLLDERKLRSCCLGRLSLTNETTHRFGAHGVDQKNGGFTYMTNLYKVGLYSLVVQTLEATEVQKRVLHLELLLRQSKVMVLLDASSPDHGVDLNYQRLKAELVSLKELLSVQNNNIQDYQMIVTRCEELLTFVESILSAIKRGPRFVDELLTGVSDDSSKRAAVILLLSQIEAARRVPSHTVAVQIALPLPEQAFRLWAQLALGIKYDKPGTVDEKAMTIASTNWKRLRKTDLTVFDDKNCFASFHAFAFYSLGAFAVIDPSLANAPEKNFDELNRAFSGMDMRNDAAHSMTYFKVNNRDNYFELLDRWSAAVVASLDGSQTRSKLLSIIQPLPLLDEQGMLLSTE